MNLNTGTPIEMKDPKLFYDADKGQFFVTIESGSVQMTVIRHIPAPAIGSLSGQELIDCLLDFLSETKGTDIADCFDKLLDTVTTNIN